MADAKRKRISEWGSSLFKQGFDEDFDEETNERDIRNLVKRMKEGTLRKAEKNRGRNIDPEMKVSGSVWKPLHSKQSEFLIAMIVNRARLQVRARDVSNIVSHRQSIDLHHEVYDAWNRCQAIYEFVVGMTYLIRQETTSSTKQKLYYSHGAAHFAEDPEGAVLSDENQEHFMNIKWDFIRWFGTEDQCTQRTHDLNVAGTDMSLGEKVNLLRIDDGKHPRMKQIDEILSPHDEWLKSGCIETDSEGIRTVMEIILKICSTNANKLPEGLEETCRNYQTVTYEKEIHKLEPFSDDQMAKCKSLMLFLKEIAEYFPNDKFSSWRARYCGKVLKIAAYMYSREICIRKARINGIVNCREREMLNLQSLYERLQVVEPND